MSRNEKFFRERRAQAVFKHGILSRYPTVFTVKTGSQWPVVLLDGYAGRGEYEDGAAGSPLLFARTAQKAQEIRKVVGVYVEDDEDDFHNLQQVMARQGRDNDHLFHGALSDHLPQIMQIACGSALLAFLDPFGPALDRQQVVGLLNRPGRAPVEVLLHISVSSVARLGGLFRRRREHGGKLDPADEKSIGHLNRFLGGEWWQRHFEPVEGQGDEERATTAALRVAEEYQAEVCREARCSAVSMPVRRHPAQLPKYVLVLFTRHGDGAWYFADAVGKAGRDWEGAWQAESLTMQLAKAQRKHPEPGLFDLEEVFRPPPFDPKEYERQHRSQWRDIIAGNIRSELTGGAFRLADRVPQVYGTTLGSAGEAHVRAAIKALYQAGVVTHHGVGRYFFRDMIYPLPSGHGRR